MHIYPGSESAESIKDNDELQSNSPIDFEGLLKEAQDIMPEGHLFTRNKKKMIFTNETGNNKETIVCFGPALGVCSWLPRLIACCTRAPAGD